MSRVEGAIVVKRGPAPSARMRAGRAQRWAQVYATIEGLAVDEWFFVPMSETWPQPERSKCTSAIRKWLAAHEAENVEVYETVDRKVCVTHRRKQQ